MKVRKYSWLIRAIWDLDWPTRKEVMTKFLTAKKKYVPKTDAWAGDILKCALCPNMCRFDCPVLQAVKSETVSPSGKARIAYLMETGRFTSEDAVGLMYECCGCEACTIWCPFGFSVEELLEGVRKDIVVKGLVPPSLLELKENVVRNHTVYKGGVTSLGLKEEGDCLYFAGCTVLNRAQEIADATLEILRKRVDVAVLPEEWCCGAPLVILGFEKEFRKVAERNAKVISHKTVVCSCPECVYMFKKVYPSFGFRLRGEILHSSEMGLRIVRGTQEKREKRKEIVYHDPCALARKLGIVNEPRELLEMCGFKVKESYSNREKTGCCGGLLHLTNPEISMLIAGKRASELREVCSSVVTACPMCKVAFKRGGCEVLDLSEVMAGV